MNRLGVFLLNLYFYLFFFLMSALLIPALIVFVVFVSFFISRRRTMKRFRRAISFYGRMTTALPFPFIRVRYERPAEEESGGPFIFVSNHNSSSDPFLMSLLPDEAVQVVNVWPFRIPVLGFFARKSGYLDINSMPREEFFEKAEKLLSEGASIIFFPEGTRSGERREMGSFHGSAFRLALKSKAPIAPLCICGNKEIPPRGSLLLKPGTVRVRRLPALRWEDYKDMNVFALKNAVREAIGKELSIMEEARMGDFRRLEILGR